MARLRRFLVPYRGAPAEEPADQALERLGSEVEAEQLRMVLSHITVGTVVGSVFAVVLAGYAIGHVPRAAVVTWLALKLVVSVPRLVQAQLFRFASTPNVHGWFQTATALLVLDGAVWGLAGSWVAVYGDPALIAVLSASLASVAAVGTFGLQVRLSATAAYSVPILVPTSIALLLRGEALGLFAGIGTALLLVVLLTTGRRSERRLAEVFRLRFVNARLAAERAEALELAEHQSKAKSQFLAAMSHELRTPLHGILGMTRLTRSQADDPQTRHQLGLIQHSGEHLLRLINDLLDLARIEAGRISVAPVAFDLALALDELLHIYMLRCHEKGLELRADVDVEPSDTVLGDATRLQQVLHNLLGNALKFTDKGSITFVARRQDGAVVFSVIDTGQGIKAEELPNLFEAFSQVGSHSRRAGGTGLGLHISKAIVEAMDGTIACSSVYGRGSTFTVSLPLPPIDRPTDLRQDSSWLVGDVARSVQRVLLAEDNEVNALIVQAMLGRCGCDVIRATDGIETIRLATTAPRPDIILMDCHMPKVDGIAATLAIRDIELRFGLAAVPIIAVTANATDEARRECREAGMDHFLPKPFNERELFAALSRFAVEEI